MTQASTKRIQTPDGISWHIEVHQPAQDQSSPEWVVLIPSGEGDCQPLSHVGQLVASHGYSVLTFDTPGFSRTTAPSSAYARVTPQLLAQQIIGLLDALHIPKATFYGCSSGGAATLALCAFHPDRVKCGIVHEVPLDHWQLLSDMLQMSDQQITDLCRGLYAKGLIELDVNNGREKWEALGADYHARLEKNFVPWVRGYGGSLQVEARALAAVPENLQRRPLYWTVGALNEGAAERQGAWKSDFEFAQAAGLDVDTKRLNCLHFPGVTVPEDLAEWICECTKKSDSQG